MNKKLLASVIFFGLFGLVGTSFAAVTIPNPLGGVNDFSTLLLKIADGVGKIIAFLGTIMIIVAGIFYLTSAGSPERVGVAKKALIYAVAGIVIGIAASAIANTIVGILR